jgi:hypothetical protein
VNADNWRTPSEIVRAAAAASAEPYRNEHPAIREGHAYDVEKKPEVLTMLASI